MRKELIMMKVLRRFNRNVRDAFKSVIRNFSLSIASISCITITLIVVSTSIIMSFNVDNFTNSIKKDVTVVVYLDGSVDGEKRNTIEEEIKKTKNIASMEFKSKEKTAEEFKNESEVIGAFLETLGEGENPLLDSYMIKVKDIDTIKKTVDMIKKIDGVDTVNYGEDIVEQLIVVFDTISKISIGTVIALVLVTAFLISNTIKLTISSRKTEIEIMRLVGASNSSIRIPFVIEGLFLGLLGSIIPIIATIYGYNSLYTFFNGKLFNSSLAKLIKPSPFVYTTSGILILIGILVGMIGSYRAVRKYLKI